MEISEKERQEVLKELRDGLTADIDAGNYMKEKFGNAIELLEEVDA